VFCRNLLIYFDRPTQGKALKRIQELLAPEGVLFVGPAEQPLVQEHGFISANIPMAFACRRTNETPGPPMVRSQASMPIASVSPRPVLSGNGTGNGQRDAIPARNGYREVIAPTRNSEAAEDPLEKARRLADAGQLVEAAEACEAHLRLSGPSAQAYYLMGLVRDAAGDASAIDYYRKALYLEPEHYETLLQLAMLSQKNGEPARARAYKSRAQRTRAKS